MARKFTFRGLASEQIKGISLDDFGKMVTSHERRSLKRNSIQMRSFIEHFRANKKKNKPTRTHVRQMVILPEMLDSHIFVYDGHNFVDLLIMPEMIGRRLGEFAHTTKLVKHSGPGIGATRGSKTVELK
jgi:small subunit ribosomal protein S19